MHLEQLVARDFALAFSKYLNLGRSGHNTPAGWDNVPVSQKTRLLAQPDAGVVSLGHIQRNGTRGIAVGDRITLPHSSSCVSLMGTAHLALSGRAKSGSPWTLLVSNVAAIIHTDMSASSAGAMVVFSLFQPSFWVLLGKFHFSNVQKIRT